MSHTVKVQIELKNREALSRSVTDLEGTIIGDGNHRLFANEEKGYGFTLPQWRYPLVAKEDGALAYDDYHGLWGNPDDITRLKTRYALAVARQAATAQGWLCEDVLEGVLVYHPEGGTLTIAPDGAVEASGFHGCGCTDATAIFADALGVPQEEAFKDEFFAERAHVSQSSE